jgi:hypothetical protein
MPLYGPGLQGGGSGDWPQDWTWPGPVLVAGDAGTGSTVNLDATGTQLGDIMVCFGVTRNGTITGPTDGGWTTVYSVDRSSSEWNKVYAKVAGGSQATTVPFVMSTTAAAGLGVFRCEHVAIDTWQHNSSTGAVTPVLTALGLGIEVGITLGAAFDAVTAAHNISHMQVFAEADASDENVKGYWGPVVKAGDDYGGHYMYSNDVGAYGSRHTLLLYEDQT